MTKFICNNCGKLLKMGIKPCILIDEQDCPNTIALPKFCVFSENNTSKWRIKK